MLSDKLPGTVKVPALIVVPPLYVLAPDKVCVPPVKLKLPVPEITPAKSSLAAVRVNALDPKTTDPEPSRLLTSAPLLVALISNVPFATNLLDVAIEPLPLRAKVPVLIVVEPV